jgi:hypothetical protein
MSSVHRTLLLALLGACASTVLASAQAAPSQTDLSTTPTVSSPVAYVYVASSNGSTDQIRGYAASSNGSLTAIPGSPFPYNVNYMAVTGSWLFGVANLDEDLYSFSIGANGGLALKDKLTVVTNGDGLISDYLDHTGATLYADLYSTNNDYLSYSIDHSTGKLTQLADLAGGPPNNSPVSFIGNNEFAYSSSCYHFGPEIIGVRRNTDGTLSYLSNFDPPYPTAPSGDFYCPWLAAADPTDHLAIAVQLLDGNFDILGPYQLAAYTVDSSGNLTTTSTSANMPSVLIGTVYAYRMSPDGKYLAIGGSLGLQLFDFHGANPITQKTGLLTRQPVNQMFWDNAGHLYAISNSISNSSGKLFVYTVTPATVKPAPGSPYSIPTPQGLIVLPKN